MQLNDSNLMDTLTDIGQMYCYLNPRLSCNLPLLYYPLAKKKKTLLLSFLVPSS